MTTVLLIVHLFVTLALIGVVLIQRSEGGGLGIGSTQGMGGFMSGRGTANLLTRATAILGTVFFLLSLGLALLNRGTMGVGRSLLDGPAPTNSSSTLPPTPAAPAGPAIPGSIPGAVPVSPPATAPAPAAAAPAASTPATSIPAAPAPVTPAPTIPAPASGSSQAPAAEAPPTPAPEQPAPDATKPN